MSVHLIKLCVGIDDVQHLADWQQTRMAQARDNVKKGGDKTSRTTHPWHVTRNRPRRGAEVLDGGSIYWVIKRVIRVRQRIVGFEDVIGEDGRLRTALVLDPELVTTMAKAHRAFQGWRYLDPAKAPADATGSQGGADLPADLARELGDLGLI